MKSNKHKDNNPQNNASASAAVLWITGLSGAGKTSIAQGLYDHLQQTHRPTVLLDGDHLRDIFSGTFGHSKQERLKASLCYGKLCKALSDQGVQVICATISLFHETQDWNRTHIPGYTEIYVKVPLEDLKKRDSKRIYSRALSGELKDVIGIDIPAEEPLNPDVVIENHGKTTVSEAVQQIVEYYDRRFSPPHSPR